MLTRPDIRFRCPPKYIRPSAHPYLLLSRCGTLCVTVNMSGEYVGWDTATYERVFSFEVAADGRCLPAISQCKTRCYVACSYHFCEVALPSGEVLRKFEADSRGVFACGGVVVIQGTNGVTVYDNELRLFGSLSHKDCNRVAVSDCGGWVITSSLSDEKALLWDMNTGEAVACVPAGTYVAVSQSASVLAVGCSVRHCSDSVQLYDCSGAALGSLENILNKRSRVCAVQFTPCGKYVVVGFFHDDEFSLNTEYTLHQYDVATMSCVKVIRNVRKSSTFMFAISPCSRVVIVWSSERKIFMTKRLYPYLHCTSQ